MLRRDLRREAALFLAFERLAVAFGAVLRRRGGFEEVEVPRGGLLLKSLRHGLLRSSCAQHYAASLAPSNLTSTCTVRFEAPGSPCKTPDTGAASCGVRA